MQVDFSRKCGLENSGNRLATLLLHLSPKSAPTVFMAAEEPVTVPQGQDGGLLNVMWPALVGELQGGALFWLNLEGGRGGPGDYSTRHVYPDYSIVVKMQTFRVT